MSRAGRRGWPSATEAHRLSPSTGARPGCWYPTCISGRAPSESEAWSSWTRTSPDSGRPTATTCTETHGRNSGTKATDLASRDGQRRLTEDLRVGDQLEVRGPV